MSIILNALRSKKDTGPSENASVPDLQEGLAWGDKKNILNSIPPSKNVLVILIGILALSLISAGLLWVLNRRSSNNEIALAMHPNAAPVAPVAQETATIATPTAKIIEKANQTYALGELDKSLELYKQVLQKEPNNAQLQNNIGLIYLKKKQLDESEKYFAAALTIDKDCATCLNNYGYLKSLQDDAILAEKYLLQASRLNREYAEPHFNLGVLYEKHGDLKNALKAYSLFLELTRDKEDPLFVKVKNHVAFLAEQ